jgi:hypothetical protein
LERESRKRKAKVAKGSRGMRSLLNASLCSTGLWPGEGTHECDFSAHLILPATPRRSQRYNRRAGDKSQTDHLRGWLKVRVLYGSPNRAPLLLQLRALNYFCTAFRTKLCALGFSSTALAHARLGSFNLRPTFRTKFCPPGR